MWLKGQDTGYQTRINAILCKAMLRALHPKGLRGHASADQLTQQLGAERQPFQGACKTPYLRMTRISCA